MLPTLNAEKSALAHMAAVLKQLPEIDRMLQDRKHKAIEDAKAARLDCLERLKAAEEDQRNLQAVFDRARKQFDVQQQKLEQARTELVTAEQHLQGVQSGLSHLRKELQEKHGEGPLQHANFLLQMRREETKRQMIALGEKYYDRTIPGFHRVDPIIKAKMDEKAELIDTCNAGIKRLDMLAGSPIGPEELTDEIDHILQLAGIVRAAEEEEA